MNNFKKNVILGIIPNEEASEILEPLMERLFGNMTSEERLNYLENLIPKYVEMGFRGLKGQEKADASKKLHEKLVNKIEEVHKIEVKWLSTPADQRAEINCC